MRRTIFDSEHDQLRETAKQFIAREVAPNAQRWEQAGIVDRSAYAAAGRYGLIGFNMPEEYGGGGSDDFRFNAVVVEELAKFGFLTPALSVHNDIVGPYLKDGSQVPLSASPSPLPTLVSHPRLPIPAFPTEII